MKTVNISSYIMTSSYKQSLRQGNEAKCWVVNKSICLKDTIMEFEFKTGLDSQTPRYEEININHLLSQQLKITQELVASW